MYRQSADSPQHWGIQDTRRTGADIQELLPRRLTCSLVAQAEHEADKKHGNREHFIYFSNFHSGFWLPGHSHIVEASGLSRALISPSDLTVIFLSVNWLIGHGQRSSQHQNRTAHFKELHCGWNNFLLPSCNLSLYRKGQAKASQGSHWDGFLHSQSGSAFWFNLLVFKDWLLWNYLARRWLLGNPARSYYRKLMKFWAWPLWSIFFSKVEYIECSVYTYMCVCLYKSL